MSRLRRRLMMSQGVDDDYIVFADANVEAICAANWGKKGKLTYKQAAKVTSLGTVFRNNTDITTFDELQYFTGLTSIGSSSTPPFGGCTSLTSLRLPNTITTLNQLLTKSTSTGGGSLVSINLPTSITVVGANALAGHKLDGLDVYLPNLTSLGADAFSYTRIQSISSLGSITNIPGYSFRYCTALQSLVLPNTLQTLHQASFAGDTSLTSIVILPATLTTVGRGIFQNCSKITTVVCLPETPPNVFSSEKQQTYFSGCSLLTHMYVPYSEDHSILAAYKAAYGWTKWTSKLYELNADGTIPS